MADTVKVPLKDQILGLSRQVGRVCTTIKTTSTDVSRNVTDELSHLEGHLYKMSRQAAAFEEEHSNLVALSNISQMVNSSLEVDEVLRIAMDTVVKMINAERGFLMLRDGENAMTIRTARNWEQESINSKESSTSRTIIGRVIESGKAILTTDAQEDPRFGGQESIIAHNMRSILCVPLKVKNDLIGVIYADNRIRSGIFTEASRSLLISFANQVAIAIENARLFTSLRHTLAEVTELKNLMDNIFSSIASGVITADIQDQITLCNKAAEAIIGQATPEIVGQQLDQIIPSIAENILPYLATMRETNEPITDLEINHILPDRGSVDWRLNLSPLKDANQTTQGVAIVLDDLTERKALEAQRRLFERMVSPAVIQQIDPDSLRMDGKRTEITILFADIRGFTSFSEKQTPEKLVSVLNRYLAAAAEAVLDEEGTVDKFLGDAVMAWFNAPLPQKDHTLRAVRTALAIRNAIEKLYLELPPEAQLGFGVGIHYGEAVLGLIGTEKKLEYTAIGDSVNTAKRVQENSQKNQILISEDAYKRVKKHIYVDKLDALNVKGKRRPIKVYEVLGLRQD
ncbi:MAG: GAF domain-containing protein [Anaerolineae bacterium]|jgi:PAS domain S-box-containing protein|nr:GAF domain-containing protein [Anaerolineae bacterium]MBT4309116.1 GAF domain-containing protein [Anaerolineae bacterium]MBT4460143.1 GAF domain-containing protein [Anaerolineae bacterium]MBT4843160.1 GAF domain-containing protein [Anaerolineae bacterium]MBT6059798.1 GAF domain-containing protein [Anaerolineae bacterium]